MPLVNRIFDICALAMVITICFAYTSLSESNTKKWIILKDCAVKVNGSTNVNKFICTVPNYTSQDTLTCFIKKSDGSVSMSGNLALPVSSFDCANPVMTKDLRKTLLANQFPAFTIYFLSMEKYPLLKPEQESITGMVNIELAGVKKLLKINYKIAMDQQKIIRMVGTKTIFFSDFNIAPPRKLGGMIQTNNQLDVEFHISCKPVNL